MNTVEQRFLVVERYIFDLTEYKTVFVIFGILSSVLTK